MRGARKHRFAALLLVICMLVSFVPSGFASGAEGTSYTYNFGRLQWGQWSNQGYSPEILTDWDKLNSLGNWHQRTSDPFMFYGLSEGATWNWTSTSAGSDLYGPRGNELFGKNGAWGGIIVRVGEGGVFTPSVRYADTARFSDAKIYLAPLGVQNPRREVYALGTVVSASSDVYSVTDVAFDKRYLPAGDYVVVAEIVSTATAEETFCWSNFSLKWEDDASDALQVELEAQDTDIEGKTELSVTASYNGDEIALSDLDELRISALDNEVAEIVCEDGTYYVIGVWSGETSLYLEARKGEDYAVATAPVEIVMPQGFVRLEAFADDVKPAYLVNDPSEIALRFTVNREEASVQASELSVSVKDPEIADAEVKNGSTVVLNGKLSGNTVLTVTANAFGTTASIDIPITVNDIKYFYNFSKAYYGQWSTYVRPMEYFTNYGMLPTTATGDLPSRYNDPTEPWKYGTKSGTFTFEVTASFRTQGYALSGGPGDWGSVIIKVAEEGTYSLVPLCTTMAGGGSLDVYLSPVGLSADEIIAEEYLIGRANLVSAGTAVDTQIPVGNVTLDAGEYNVVFRWAPDTAVGNGGGLNGIYLKALAQDEFELFAKTPAAIMETTDGEIPLVSRFNGADIGFADVTDLTVVSADESIATAEVVRDGDTASLAVHGVSAGQTKLTVSGTYGELTATYTVNVDIASKKRIDKVSLRAEKTVINAEETVQLIPEGTYYDGTEIDFAAVDVYYESSDATLVSVDANGVVTGKEKGEATVRLWVQQDDQLRSAELLIVVGSYATPTVTIDVADYILKGKVVNLSVSATSKGGNVIPSNQYTATYELVAADPEGRVRLAGNRIRSSAVGTCTIRATVELFEKEYVIEKTIEIVAELPEEDDDQPTLSGVDIISLDVDKTLLSVGEHTAAKLGAYYMDGSFAEYDAQTMSLHYDDTVISYENGVITALKSGETELTLECEGVSDSITITVDEETLGSAAVELSDVLYQGKTSSVLVEAYLSDGRAVNASDLIISYASANENIATVDASGVVTGVAAGETTITVKVELAEADVSAILPVEVLENSTDSIRLTTANSTIKPTDEGTQVSVSVVSVSGDVTPADVSNVVFESLTPEILAVNGDGFVTPVGALGTGIIRATFTYGGVSVSSEIAITVKDGKSASTYFTEKRRNAIRNNAANYQWAKNQYDSVVINADKWVGREDEIIDMMTTQEVPRSIWATYRYDPDNRICAYCEKDLGTNYPYLIDNIGYPYKIQCPECRRRFPSNDFKAFYDTGIDEHGNWNYELAKQNGSHLLTNDMYPEKGAGFAVDDGYGYKTGKTFMTSYGEWEHTYVYVAYWNHWGNWYSGGNTYSALSHLTYGYVYTGKKEYGRTLAILVDRLADLYPDMNTGVYEPYLWNNGWYGGKVVGGIWETGVTAMYSKAYDSAFDMYDDPYVMSYIQKNAAKYGMTHKNSPAEVREHIETGLLREAIEALYDKRIYGNQGYHQNTSSIVAVVLDNMPESKELIDWTMTGEGATMQNIMNTVDHDGQGNENSVSYNIGWIAGFGDVAANLAEYTAYPSANLYTNPKFIKMMKMNLPLTVNRNTTLNIGDSASMAVPTFQFDAGIIGQALTSGCDDPELAQIVYFMNGNSASGSYGRDIMTDAGEMERKVQELVDEYGEYDFDKSTQLTAFGVGVLRGGTYRKDNLQNINTQRSAALWYGATYGHGHHASLELFLNAYGFDFLPSVGYPTSTLGTGTTKNWECATVSHNTVMVNETKQYKPAGTTRQTGDPLHFDDSGRVKLVDANNKHVYSSQGVSEFRRTAVMVEVNDADAYTIDFFRVKGGNDHIYSFHAQSNEIADYTGLTPVHQAMGTYAGPGVPYGPGNLTSGLDSFYDVYRSSYPGKEFSVTFKMQDFHKVLKEDRDLYLKMTQLNDFDLTDVSWATAEPPEKGNDLQEIKYVLARRTGKDLDSLFTTVLEPYDKTPFVKSAETVAVARVDGKTGGAPAKAVKVTLASGRVDYIVYASDSTIRYRIDDKFDFMGFLGVVSYEGDEVVYRYMHDSTLVAGMYGTASLSGSVVDFTKENTAENFITVRLTKAVDAAELVGKTVYINNAQGAVQNSAYMIHGAVQNRDGTYTLDIGDVSLISAQSVADASYSYNISAGQSAVIPLTVTEDGTPVVEAIGQQAVTVGSTLTVPINAESPIGQALTYQVVSNTSGTAMVGNVLHFSPSKEQVGNVVIQVEISDGINTTTVTIGVDVYPATSSGGGGGGGGASGGDDTTTEVTYTDNGDNTFTGSDGSLICAGPDKTVGTADDITDVIVKDGVRYIKNADGALVGAGADGLLGTADDAAVATEKFVDLGNHAWAKEAIYRLVEAGVIKGVAEDKFAPAAQITRADFAILLVRAWNLTADEIGTYDDVAASDYFANEVGIAAANGIVNGVGDGKFAPRAPITREQMMVMLHRTLTAQGIELDAADEAVLASFSDADAISDYAVDAVKLMVANGYIQGSNLKINPQGNATRAEVAVLLDRILNK